MKYQAVKSFSGLIRMTKGEVREFSDRILVNSLLKSGYIIPVEEKTRKKKAEKTDEEN